MSRRPFVWLTLSVLGAAFAGGPAVAKDLKFGFTPVLGQADERAEFEPLMSYLSDVIGQKIVLWVAKDYGDLRTQMEAGGTSFGAFRPASRAFPRRAPPTLSAPGENRKAVEEATSHY